mmetsp:Transcript_35566/g.84889  ORF Transcript_35566/g.84889 Transcript_35566/m.84889 type:complete len:90 (+) Transcript_35566:289-558(+)
MPLATEETVCPTQVWPLINQSQTLFDAAQVHRYTECGPSTQADMKDHSSRKDVYSASIAVLTEDFWGCIASCPNNAAGIGTSAAKSKIQ